MYNGNVEGYLSILVKKVTKLFLVNCGKIIWKIKKYFVKWI